MRLLLDPSWIRTKGRKMRTLLLVTSAAVLILGTLSFAGAAPWLSDEAAVAANSSKKIGVRLAEIGGNNNYNGKQGYNNNHHGIASLLLLLNEWCERREERAQYVSQSRPNNGFGNCGRDGVPGKSGKQDVNR
jgi:hypothetical protein